MRGLIFIILLCCSLKVVPREMLLSLTTIAAQKTWSVTGMLKIAIHSIFSVSDVRRNTRIQHCFHVGNSVCASMWCVNCPSTELPT